MFSKLKEKIKASFSELGVTIKEKYRNSKLPDFFAKCWHYILIGLYYVFWPFIKLKQKTYDKLRYDQQKIVVSIIFLSPVLFGFIVCRQPFDSHRNRPDIVLRRVRTADAFGVLPFVEEGIFITQQCAACRQIQRVFLVAVAKIRCRHQTWDVRVVHDTGIPQSVHFISKDRLSGFVRNNGIISDALLDIAA